jgi:hypothetical protein
MSMKRFLLLIFLTIGSAAFGLASDYRIKSVRVLPIDSYNARTTQDGMTIAADPYATDQKSFTAFDVRDLNSRGYFPVHLIIQNAAADYITFSTRRIMLVTANGQELYPTPATLLVEDIFRESRLSKWTKLRPNAPKTGSPLIDFTSKELTTRQIGPGGTADGFVFFFAPGSPRAFFSGSKLLIPELLTEGSQRKMGPFAIPLDPAQAQASPKP